MSLLSVLIVNYNSWKLCADAVRSLRENAPTTATGEPMPFEVIVVDNASPIRDQAAEAKLEKELRGIGKLIRHDQNGGYSGGMNLALSHAAGDVILVSNPDVLYKPGCVDKLLRLLETDPTVGAAAPQGFWDEELHGRLPPNIVPTLSDLTKLTIAAVSPRHIRRYSQRRTKNAVAAWEATCDLELAMLSGCCFVMTRALIDQIGFFDERYPLYYEDTDLSLRIRKAGKRIVQVYGAQLVHLYNRSGQTANELALERYWVSQRRFYRKWYGKLGFLYYRLTRWFLSTGWAERRRQLPPQEIIHDAGRSHDKPVLELGRHYDSYLVEIALDPCFYLAAGVFGSGEQWTPSDSLFKGFGPTVYYFRVVDLTRPGNPLIGVYRYELLYPSTASPDYRRMVEAEGPVTPQPELSVVVLSWNTRDLTLACLGSLYAETPRHRREVIVVDNGSSDGSADAIAAEFPQVILQRNAENTGFSGGNNQGARLATGRRLCLLNSDTEVRPGALDRLVDFLIDNPSYGAVAPKLVNPDGSVQRACMRFPGIGTACVYDTFLSKFPPGKWVDDRYYMRAFDHLSSRDVQQPPGACLMLGRVEYLTSGGLDEDLWLFFNDVDLCRRLWRHGRRIRYLADAEVVHHGGASTKRFDKFVVIWHRNRMAYYRKQYGRWAVPLLRLVVRLRSLEERIKIRFNQKDVGSRRAARSHLDSAVREILAP